MSQKISRCTQHEKQNKKERPHHNDQLLSAATHKPLAKTTPVIEKNGLQKRHH
jgi:hypothetical protein